MKNSHILVIEDEQDIRDLISFHLKSEGYRVTSIESADKAISVLESGEKIDLFLVDWMLPGFINGLEFIRKLRQQKQFENIPVIMLTALTQPENIVSGLDAGADDYITKPFDLKVLDARIRVQLRTISTIERPNNDILDYDLLKIEINKCRVQ